MKKVKMKAHYLRVSTPGQNSDRQFTDGNKELIMGAKRYKEKDSGRVPFAEREKGKMLIEDIKAGEITEVHVHSIDRLGRNTLDVLNTIQFFTSKGVNLITKQEGLKTLNEDGTENLTSKLIINVLSTLAEWDYNKRREAQAEGISIAVAKKKYKGRKAGTTESDDRILKKHKKVLTALELKNSLRDCAKIAGVSLGTVQKVRAIAVKKGLI